MMLLSSCFGGENVAVAVIKGMVTIELVDIRYLLMDGVFE